MSSERYDLVIYGATGYTGQYIVKQFINSKYNGYTFAVAGRNEEKLRKVLSEISASEGKDITDTPIIIAKSSDTVSLNRPYRLYGEEVVKAAIENGSSHVDISGEPAFLEKMVLKYGKTASEKGVYIVGACGWDSIPCDLGINFLRNNYEGDIAYTESLVQNHSGPAGYSINDGTYQTLILAIANIKNDKLGKIRKEIMPETIPRSNYKPPKRGFIFYNDDLKMWALPFMGSDKSVVYRSQYDCFTKKNQRPIYLSTYFGMKSLLMAVIYMIYFGIFSILCQFGVTRKFLQDNTDLVTFGAFSKKGPTKEQVDGASFTYWFISKGWNEKKKLEDGDHTSSPTKKIISRCDGPDAGYVGTSGCALSAAITILEGGSNLPKKGGVYTPATAFGESPRIYSILEDFGIKFKIEKIEDLQ
ncbi:Saccharopine dehydrogenase-like oxidoreductase [Strongyloides ratti]|uniref:Saccharopine dehydrogenase-like oxidoreductase n=1 Tax=Strongyloides ratti TaxID=34506 RepID=A0A090KWK4_STRRB|nr:Saccharopine dehydrogenase-like oxidoreductase [Strongyloides ratti]CEF59632.1 Saccharopine dehydrogenase-like oxidoreductase [Strongyloides ratti]